MATRWADDPTALALDVMHWGGLSWAACWNGAPVAALGAVEQWPGVWSCWMFATDDIPHIGLSLTRFAKYRMIPAIRDLGGHRGEARSMVDHTEAHRWLRSIGAREEARLSGYGKHGEDFLVFSWD